MVQFRGGKETKIIRWRDNYNYSTTWSLSHLHGHGWGRSSWQSHTIPSSSWMLSGIPDIVFLRLTFLGRRVRVSVFIRERRTLACLSNVSPGDQLTRTDKQKGQLVTYMQSEHTHVYCASTTSMHSHTHSEQANNGKTSLKIVVFFGHF